MEKLISLARKPDSPYVAGKIRAAYHSSKLFKECFERMKDINKYTPWHDQVVVKVITLEEKDDFVPVNKRMIFGMYLVKMAILNDLREAGKPEIAETILKMFPNPKSEEPKIPEISEVKPTIYNPVLSPTNFPIKNEGFDNEP